MAPPLGELAPPFAAVTERVHYDTEKQFHVGSRKGIAPGHDAAVGEIFLESYGFHVFLLHVIYPVCSAPLKISVSFPKRDGGAAGAGISEAAYSGTDPISPSAEE